jgi:hypothetical protein
MKVKLFLLGLLISLCTSGAYAANRPVSFVTICKEGKTCTLINPTTVAFGRADTFLYKILKGSFSCSAATFGSRIVGGNNECSIRKP